jgi:hypothetical protein
VTSTAILLGTTHARLVAKGFLQREGVDYGDIFSRDDNVADSMVKAYIKAMHRTACRQVMGPYQRLRIQHIGGETLKRRIEDIDE